MKCHICKDFMPMYCDNLLSEETMQDVREHLDGCADCRAFYAAAEQPADVLPEQRTAADPLRKVRRRHIRHVLSAVGGTLAACGLVFLFVFWGVVPITESRCHYTVTASEFEGRPTLDFLFDADCACIRARAKDVMTVTADGKSTRIVTHLWIYPVTKLPFDDHGEFPDQFELGTMAREGDVLVIHYLGKTVSIDSAKLHEELTQG